MERKLREWRAVSRFKAVERHLRRYDREKRESEVIFQEYFGCGSDDLSDEQWATFTQFMHEAMSNRTVN